MFKMQDTGDICDRSSIVTSILTVRGECREAGTGDRILKSDLCRNGNLVTPCTTISNLSTHPGNDLRVYIDFGRNRRPEYTSLLGC